MIKWKEIVALIWLVILYTNINAQGFLKTVDKEIHNERGENVILRGMGLGGWMLQEGYMLQTASFANAQHKIKESIQSLIGKESTQEFYEAWLDNHVTKTDIDSLNSWGFNSVRLPMHYNLYTLPIEEEPVSGEHTWLEKGFELTDNLIEWCRANDMYVILDLHAAPGGQGKDEGISDYDPSKPSLWESDLNREKTIALWRRLAERYVDEPVIAGYDLINETNWEMDNNNALKSIYLDITDAIREVDNNHIIFIEGNWFANDFTNLTPPWDDNMVYSPHKYWSFNNKESIQWVLNIRDEFNVPLYLGEAGENSNIWFGDAIRLLEDNNIGWAWWPMKKIESISGPLSINKSKKYQELLDYWNGSGTRPSSASVKATLMILTEDLKTENCRFQKDVIDAMFRQVRSSEAVPYRTQEIPGLVFATDYDMGVLGSAYMDNEAADYRVSTGNFTAWNNGWIYRNDGVDIELSQDFVNTNGYNVGWLNADEWMQYDVNIAESGLYDVTVRIAANEANGAFHFSIGESAISSVTQVPNTNGWQNWQTLKVEDVFLDKEDKKLRFYVDNSGFNVGSFRFCKQENSNQQLSNYVDASTISDNSIRIAIDKPLSVSSIFDLEDFIVTANGEEIPILSISLDPENARLVIIELEKSLSFDNTILVSYSGTNLMSSDGSQLQTFMDKLVENNLVVIYSIPGRLQAEDYFNQSGIQLENTTDTGGGQNIGFLDVGDFLDYNINIEQAGSYVLDIRTAALSEMGGIKMELINNNDESQDIGTFTFPSTGDWQSWQTSMESISLPEGLFTLRVTITQALFNINYFDFNLVTPTIDESVISHVDVFPNPSSDYLTINAVLHNAEHIQISLQDLSGRILFKNQIQKVDSFIENLDISTLQSGLYFVKIIVDNKIAYIDKITKTELN